MISAALLFPMGAEADVVLFKTGAAKIGIIEEETPSTVKLRIRDVVIGISRDNIEKIEYATPEENESLRFKWEEEKREAEEERERKRRALEKFEREQQAKGLINVNGEWVTPMEIERRRQRNIEQRVQGEGSAQPEATGAEEESEIEVPEIVEGLSTERQEAYIESLERQKQLEISQIRTDPQGARTTILTGRVLNKSDRTARKIYLEIVGYDQNGEEIVYETSQVSGVAPKKLGRIHVPLRIENEFLDKTEIRIIDAEWE